MVIKPSMDGSFQWSGAEGIADPDGTPMTPEPPYFIASITKLFMSKKEVTADAQ